MTDRATIAKLLRAVAGGTDAQKSRHDVIFREAASMIDPIPIDDPRNVTPYDPHGVEVSALHEWFAVNGAPHNWHDDGCRSEQARSLLNFLASKNLLVIEVQS